MNILQPIASVFRILIPFTLLFFVFAADQGAAQSQSQFHAGMKSGYQFSSFGANSPEGHRYILRGGYSVGAFMGVPVTRGIYFQPEFLYMQKGSIERTPDDLPSIYYRLEYLEMPVLSRFVLIQDDVAEPSVYFGPSFGYVLNADRGPGNDRTAQDISDYTEALDISVAGGVALEYFLLEGGRAMLDLRFHHSVNNLLEEPGGLHGEEDTSTNFRNFGFMMSLSFAYP